MRNILIIICIFITSALYSQNFTLRVKRIVNNCTGSIVKDLQEPQMKWTITSEKAEFYFVSRSNSSEKETIHLYNVKEFKVQDDPVNGRAYIYTVSNYKNGDGILMYVLRENFVKLTINGQSCSIIYELYY